MLRQEEDWTFLKLPNARTEPLDALKHIALSDTAFVYFGGGVRLRSQFVDNEFQGLNPGPDLRFQYRANLHGGLVVAERAGLFVELASSDVVSARYPVRGPDVDRLDLNQAFVEFGSLSPGDRHSSSALLRIGRQELDYGSGRIIAVREGPNVRQSFDGAMLRLRARGWTADVLAFQPVDTRSGVLDDPRQRGGSLFGIYATHRGKTGSSEVYVIGATRRDSAYARLRGREQRYTIGGRLQGKVGSAALEGEAAVQLGQLTLATGSSVPISAWTIAGSATVPLASGPRPVELGLGFGVASGDSGGRSLGTWRSPFPTGRYFGASTNLGPGNIGGLDPSIAVAINKNIKVKAFVYTLWRLNRGDALYSPPGFIVRPPGPSAGRHIGEVPGLSADLRISPHFTAGLLAEHFVVGNAFDGSPRAKDTTFIELRTEFKF